MKDTHVATMVRRTPPRCAVSGCADPDTHLTRGHVCERCGGRGHGVLECGDHHAQRRLRRATRHHRLPPETMCTHPGCRCPTAHTEQWHDHRRSLAGVGTHDNPATRAVACPLCKREVVAHDTIFLPSDVSCVVCMQRDVSVLMTPCNHACVCAACFARMQSLAVAT